MRTSARRACVAILTSLAAVTAHAAGPAHPARYDLVLFGSAEAYLLDGDDPAYDEDGLELAADIVGSWSAGRFRAFGELLLATEEQELERLQLGWELAPETFAWLGRFHQPASAWNTSYHHGQYLQPSITRPAIEEWEDEGGVLPQHVEGLLLETRRPLAGGQGFAVSFSAGIGPVLGAEGLEPFEVLSSRTSERRPAFGLQVKFLPVFSDDDGFGLVASHDEIGFEEGVYAGPANHIDLELLGAYLAWDRGPWQVQATVYSIRSDFSGEAGGGDSFVAGYLQVQREFGGAFKVLARFEDSVDAAGSGYLRLFPDFVEQRSVLDLRWDFDARQALTFEYADGHAREGRFNAFRLQWSAAFQ